MQINPSHHLGPIPASWDKARGPREVSEEASPAAFEASESLNNTLRSLPEARAEVVEHARTLIHDAGYPPPEAIERIAHLLALKIKETE